MNASLLANISAVFGKMFNIVFWQRLFSFVEKELALFTCLHANGNTMNQGKTMMLYCSTLLALFNGDEFAGQCSEVQYFLEEIDRDYAKEGRQANLERVLIYCQQASEVYRREQFLVADGALQMLAGFISIELAAVMNEPEEIYEQALVCYLHAESIFVEEKFPLQWATIQQWLSFVYIMRKGGKKVTNLQQAITRGQSSLRIFTRTAFPLEWAGTHMYLGEAYRQATSYIDLCELYSGCSSMQEQALRHLEAALQICTAEKYPLEWAEVQRFLGMIYLDRVRGRRDDNLEQAKESFEAALQVMQCEFSPLNWASTQAFLSDVSLALGEI